MAPTAKEWGEIIVYSRTTKKTTVLCSYKAVLNIYNLIEIIDFEILISVGSVDKNGCHCIKSA